MRRWRRSMRTTDFCCSAASEARSFRLSGKCCWYNFIIHLIARLIPHFLPFCQKFIENLSVGLRSAVQKDDRAGVDARQKLGKCFFFGWLLILHPVHIGETPEKGLVAELLCHLQVRFTVFALRRTVIFFHCLPGDGLVECSRAVSSFSNAALSEMRDISDGDTCGWRRCDPLRSSVLPVQDWFRDSCRRRKRLPGHGVFSVLPEWQVCSRFHIRRRRSDR